MSSGKGTFIEEWHQKLHNNSTPDDIIICEAYLAFLHSNGSLDEFWRVINENGISKETLRKVCSRMLTYAGVC
jgi:alpha-glucan,water dikinase